MFRSLLFYALASLASLPLWADDGSPNISSVDVAVIKMGDKVSGHVGACLVTLGDRPLAGFGLNKEFDKPAEYTYFLVFKTGGKKFAGSGSGAEVNSDGKKTTYKVTFDVGDVELPLQLETVRDEKGTLVSSKVEIGKHTLMAKGPRVVVVDLTASPPTFQLVKTNPPENVPDLSKDDTWPNTLKLAVEELKKKSPELRKLID